MPSYKELMVAQKVAKKTKKRQRKLTKSLQALKVCKIILMTLHVHTYMHAHQGF